jgi:hypothetical protein
MATSKIQQDLLDAYINTKTITTVDSVNITDALNQQCVPVPKGFTVVHVVRDATLTGVCLMCSALRNSDANYGACLYISYYADGASFYHCINGVWSKKT